MTDLTDAELEDAFVAIVRVLDTACNVGVASAKKAEGGMEIFMFLETERAREWAAQGMEAATAGETGTGSTEGDSPVGEADAPERGQP